MPLFLHYPIFLLVRQLYSSIVSDFAVYWTILLLACVPDVHDLLLSFSPLSPPFNFRDSKRFRNLPLFLFFITVCFVSTLSHGVSLFTARAGFAFDHGICPRPSPLLGFFSQSTFSVALHPPSAPVRHTPPPKNKQTPSADNLFASRVLLFPFSPIDFIELRMDCFFFMPCQQGLEIRRNSCVTLSTPLT